uniref:U3 small nucleolar RNA-associated protein 11 n=1 Tax=Rhabditophanes sp. KR3021 TaxID=114890 RepID=A0AC35TRC0_9BILA
MSSMRNKNKAIQREHRERPQIKERAHLGILEKKKDWIVRARDFQEKRDKIESLRGAALTKNPDEFTHHMIRSQIGRDGVHRSFDMNAVMEVDKETKNKDLVKDLQYIDFKLHKNKKQIEKLKSTLQLSGVNQSMNVHKVFLGDDSDDEVEMKSRPGNKAYGITTSELTEEAKESYRHLAELVNKVKEQQVVRDKLNLQLNMRHANKQKIKPKVIKKGGEMKAAVVKFPLVRKR